ncbi:hypothetical protein HYY72_03250, partial [Candidatus Woesearchaeota archaeon]|nr:hypothetical protein [Candidatus Woesearchaeota archaeon]
MKKLKALLFALIPLLLLALQDSSACAWYGCSSWHTAGCASPDATTGCRACTYDCDASNCCECGGGGSWQGMECPSGSSGSGSSVPTCSAESVSTNSGGQVRVETQTGYGTGEMVCQPSDCDSGMALVGTLSDVLGNNLNFHNYKVCVSGAAGGYTLACESDHTTEANICNPGSCDAGYVSIGDIHELHWEWARNYRICVQGIASGSIISCDSNANNNEADICNPGSCGANELLVGDVHELHNSIWRNYRVCVRPNTRVSGTLRYKGGGGVISSTTQTINTCITGVSPTVQPATSATQGSFYFDTGLYSGFCIRAPDMTGYTKTAVNKRGSDTTSYEWQKAGINCATAPSGSCNANQVNRDRATDSGYDFEYCLNDGGLGCSIAAGGSGTTNCCSSDAQCDVVVAGPTSRCIRCDANHRQTSPAVDYGGGLCKSACGASSYCNWAEPGYSYDYGTTPVCCKSDCSADTAKPSCSAVGTASGGSCYTAGQTTSCTTSGWSACSGGTTTSCSAGTASCSDSGAAVGGTCYWGESCSASGYTAPTSAVIDDGMACTVDACTSTGVTHTFDNTISGCGISFRCYYKSATEYNCKDCADQTNCQSTSGCLWCPAVASVDVTDSGNAPLTSGKCRDYSAPSAGSCAAPGACSNTDYSDACGTSNTDMLTETYASAASCL